MHIRHKVLEKGTEFKKETSCYYLSFILISTFLDVVYHFLCATSDWLWLQELWTMSHKLVASQNCMFDPRRRLFLQLTSCVVTWNFWINTVAWVSFRLMTCVQFIEALNFPAGLQCRNCSSGGMHCCTIQPCHAWQLQLCETFTPSSSLVCRVVPFILRLRNSCLAQ